MRKINIDTNKNIKMNVIHGAIYNTLQCITMCNSMDNDKMVCSNIIIYSYITIICNEKKKERKKKNNIASDLVMEVFDDL